jgi:hypothetical protein
MKTDETESGQTVVPVGHATLGGAHLRTLQALFRHPTAHNLEWMDVIALFGKIGTVHQKANAKFALELAGEHYLLQKAHTKDLTSSEVVDLRHFLQRAGWSPEGAPQAAARRDLEPAVLVVVVDHHGAKLYRVEPGSGGASAHQIRPYDPHHYLHHLTHKDQSREEGQRAPEDHTFYAQIGAALAAAGQILVVGHGTGKSNAARHLVEYLRVYHNQTYQRVVREVEADLSAITMPQILELAERALGLRS